MVQNSNVNRQNRHTFNYILHSFSQTFNSRCLLTLEKMPFIFLELFYSCLKFLCISPFIIQFLCHFCVLSKLIKQQLHFHFGFKKKWLTGKSFSAFVEIISLLLLLTSFWTFSLPFIFATSSKSISLKDLLVITLWLFSHILNKFQVKALTGSLKNINITSNQKNIGKIKRWP